MWEAYEAAWGVNDELCTELRNKNRHKFTAVKGVRYSEA
jgi:hypothetical protein